MAERKDLGTAGLVSSMLGDDNVLVTIDGKVRQIPAASLIKSLDPIRIESLAELSNSEDPRGVWVEVIDSNGDPKKMRISSIPQTEGIENQLAYGVRRASYLLPDTEMTRIGNLDLHKSLPVQSLMRGCLLDNDGKVKQYLPESSWVGAVRDGSAGQVMVEIPAHYELEKRIGVVREYWMSLYPIAGYRYVPKMYVSAYQASLDRTNMMLSSVVNTTAQFRGGNNNADWDSTDKTLLGRPVTALSRTSFRNYARKRKPGSTEWNLMTYDVQRTLYVMFMVEYATLNSQKAVNTALSADGYRQGGLGNGVSNIKDYASWTAFNNNNPFIPCGYTDSLGNGSGEIAYTMPDSYTTAAGAALTVYVNRYRGVEMPFGHINIFCDGYNMMVSAETADGGTGQTLAYVCSDPGLFSDTSNDGYRFVCECNRNGYITAIAGGPYLDIVPMLASEITATGGSSSFFCDYHYGNSYPTSGTQLRAPLLGGHSYYGSLCGLAYVYSHYAPSASNPYFGSRLCFIPKTAA